MRLLLVLCLILNGIGNAMAAAAMPAMMGDMSQHVGMAMDAPAGDPQSASACDQADPGTMPAAPPLDQSPSKATHPADCDQDCCSQGACKCPCMQWAHAALLDVPAVPTVQGRTDVASLFPADHAAPLLHNVIRPPIG